MSRGRTFSPLDDPTPRTGDTPAPIGMAACSSPGLREFRRPVPGSAQHNGPRPYRLVEGRSYAVGVGFEPTVTSLPRRFSRPFGDHARLALTCRSDACRDTCKAIVIIAVPFPCHIGVAVP